MPSYRDSGPAVEAAPIQAALLTPVGRGALAVVGVAGAAAADLVDRNFESAGGPVAARADGAICFGRWRQAARAAGEELVVVRHSARRVEVHCHGGEAASAAVIASLVAGGAVQVGWADWLRATGASEIEHEARAALAAAAGPKAARILCRQLAGALARELEQIETLGQAADKAAVGPAVARLRAAARVGLRLTSPWRVVVAGPVNAGKSSLVNALAGHARSLVSAEPGTTRDLVTTRIVLDGWEIELVDTAGLRDAAAGAVERAGIAKAVAARADADLVLRVVPCAAHTAAPVEPREPEIVVLTKADLAVGPSPLPAAGAVVTSAVTGAGIEELAARIVDRLVPEERADPPLLAGAVPFTERQLRWIEEIGPPLADRPHAAGSPLPRRG